MDQDVLRSRIAELYRSVKPLDASTDITSTHHAYVASKLDEVAAEAERSIFPAASASTDGDLKDDAARLYRQLAISNSWLNEREERTRRWIDRAAELASNEVLRDMVVGEQNNLRDAEAFPEIRSLCRQGMVDKARRVLVKRRRQTTDPVMRRRIDEFLAEPRNFLAPLGGAPTMSTINGFGTMLHGNRDGRSDGTYVSTLCLVALFLPLFPLRAYVVQSQGTNSYVFYGRVPLSPFAFWWRKMMILLPMVAALGLWGADAWNSSPYIRETGFLSEASGKLSKRDYAGALAPLSKLSGTRDASRLAKLDDLFARTMYEALTATHTPDDAARFVSTIGTAASRLKRPLSGAIYLEMKSALKRIASKPSAGTAARNFLTWMGTMDPGVAADLPHLAANACDECDDPVLLAATIEFFLQAGKPCPEPIVTRLSDHLTRTRHPTWNVDALSYLKVADPAQAAPILLQRCEAAWKGAAQEPDLLGLKSLPAPLRRLLELDAEKDPEKCAAGLESAAAPDGLKPPQDGWHHLGVARRLSKVLGTLNEKDPVRFPVSKARPWAIQAAELSPEDLALRGTALRYLIEDGDYARAIALGGNGTDDPKIGTYVGIALARSGKLEEAAQLLRPRVHRDLPLYSRAFEAWSKAITDKSESLWRSLQSGSAPRPVITRLNSLPKERAIEEAQQWVGREVARDSFVVQQRRLWMDKVDVHPAASELAMVELSLGQSMRPGPERTARLEAAEHLFLDLRKISGDDPHQELRLAQVYCWLGKDKEGAEIFERLEKSEDVHLLSALAEVYRNLARKESARQIYEKAYGKAVEKEKPNIAFSRAISAVDLSDRLTWLRKSDLSSAGVKVEIDSAEARIAMNAGKFESAVAPLRRAVAYYAALPESSMSQNNGSIVMKELARATGDSKHDYEALRMMRRAHELSPEDAIVLSNYINDLESIAYIALAGNALQQEVIHERPERDWLEYVVPRLSAEEWAARAKAQPELRRAAELAVKSAILSPDGSTGYTMQKLYFLLTRDGAGIRKLRESLEARPTVREEDSAQDEAHARGEWSDFEKKQTEAAVTRWELLMPSIRKAGHAPTLGYALKSLAGSRHVAARMGIASQKLETAIEEAEESIKVFDAPPSREILAWLLAEQAAKAVAAGDAEFARWAKESPSLSEAYLLPLYLRKHPDRAASLLARDDVRRATAAVAGYENSDPRKRSVWSWSWLEMAGHDLREKARKAIASHPAAFENDRLTFLLSPRSASDAIGVWLSAIACGNEEVARKVADQAEKTKLVPSFFRK